MQRKADALPSVESKWAVVSAPRCTRRSCHVRRKLRLHALRLEAFEPLLESGALPMARKEPAPDARPKDHGLLRPVLLPLSRLLDFGQRADSLRSSLHQELRLGEMAPRSQGEL